MNIWGGQILGMDVQGQTVGTDVPWPSTLAFSDGPLPGPSYNSRQCSSMSLIEKSALTCITEHWGVPRLENTSAGGPMKGIG